MKKEIIDYKTEAEHLAASKIVETNLSQFEEERQLAKNKEAAEKEALLAEASRLTGRVEAFNFTSQVATVATLINLQKIKESHIYKELPSCKTWEDYCNSIGFSRRKIDEDLQNLNTFGENFLATGRQLGLGYRDLRSLSKQVKTGNLEVKEAEVIIDGEVIPLDNKDELKDALDTLLKSKYEELAKKDKELETVRIVKDKFASDKERAETKVEELQNQISKLKNNKPTFKNVSVEDTEDFQKLLNIEINWGNLLMDLKAAVENNQLSDFNKGMLGGIIAQMILMLDDFRMRLNGESQFYFNGVYLDEEYLSRCITPQDFLNIQK